MCSCSQAPPRHGRTLCCWRGPARCPAEAVGLSQAWSHASRQLPGSTRVQSKPAWERGLLLHSAAAAAKSLQSCPTLCDPIDGSLPGSSVPGILQARTRVGCHCLLPSCTLAPGQIMHEFHSHVGLPRCKAAVDGGTRCPPPPRLQPARGGSSGRALPPDQSPEVLCAFKWAAGVGFCFPYIFIAQLLSPPSDVLVTSRLGLTGLY